MAEARLWSRLRSTTARIALALLAVQLVSVGTAILVIRSETDRALYASSREFVRLLQADLQDAYRSGGQVALKAAIKRRIDTIADRDAAIGLRDRQGHILAGNLERWPQSIERVTGWQNVGLRREEEDEPVNMGVSVTRLPDATILVSGDILIEEARIKEAGERALLIASLVGLILSIAGSLLLARFIGRKVQRVAGVADEVAEGRLDRRIENDGSGDAFDRLGDAFNHMISRLEVLVTELRLVTDSIAHDLRSPVARVKRALDQLWGNMPDEAAQLAVGVAMEETDRLDHMLSTALQISRAEAGLGRDQFSHFSANGFVEDLAEVYGPLAEERGFLITLGIRDDFNLFAHRQLLTQAVANLIDNALKYAAGADQLLLSIARQDGHVSIMVADNGPGIAVDNHAEALRRFGRLDRARNSAGAGLGLSLVTTVAHLHGGEVKLDDAEPGLKVRIIFPEA